MGATDVRPLLIPSQKRTVETAGRPVRESKLGREVCRYGRFAVVPFQTLDAIGSNLGWHLPLVGPQQESDAVPT